MTIARLMVAAGSGRLVRRSSVVLFDPAAGNDSLVAVFQGAADDAAAVVAIKKHLIDSGFAASPLAVVQWVGSHVDLLVFGDVEVHTSAVAAPMVTGAGSATWIEHHLGAIEMGDSTEVELWCGDDADPATDLQAGSVRAGAFRLALAFTDPPASSVPATEAQAAAAEVSDPPAAPPAPPAPTLPGEEPESPPSATDAAEAPQASAAPPAPPAPERPAPIAESVPPAEPDAPVGESPPLDSSPSPSGSPPPPTGARSGAPSSNGPPPPVTPPPSTGASSSAAPAAPASPVAPPSPGGSPPAPSGAPSSSASPPPPSGAPSSSGPPPPVTPPPPTGASSPAASGAPLPSGSPPPPSGAPSSSGSPPPPSAAGLTPPTVPGIEVDNAATATSDGDGDFTDDEVDPFTTSNDASASLVPAAPLPSFDADPPTEPGPPPSAPPSEAEPAPEPERERVEGGLVEAALCRESHPNPPRTATCYVCGIDMIDDQSLGLIEQPTVGRIVFTSGQGLALAKPVKLGRKPDSDEGTHPVVIDHAEVSRTHASIKVEGWTVLLSDEGSRNGTWVTPASDPTPMRLDADVPHVLEDGDTVHLGGPEVSFTYHFDAEPA